MPTTTCPRHNAVALRHCPICHRPICSQCPGVKDGCCSAACASKRAAWKPATPVRKPSRLGDAVRNLVMFATAAALLYAVAIYVGWVPEPDFWAELFPAGE